jgi:hypothetical protein
MLASLRRTSARTVAPVAQARFATVTSKDDAMFYYRTKVKALEKTRESFTKFRP